MGGWGRTWRFAHHPFRHGETYDQQLGNATRKAIGNVRWNKRVKKAIGNMRRLTNFDHLFMSAAATPRRSTSRSTRTSPSSRTRPAWRAVSPSGGTDVLRGEAEQLRLLAHAAQAMAAKRHQFVAAGIGGPGEGL